GRRDRGHRRGLHELRWMRLRGGNTDRLKDVFLIKRIVETAALGWRPVHGLVGKLDTFGLGDGRRRWLRGGAREITANGARRCGTSDRHRAERRGDRASWRDVLRDPGEQRRHIGRAPCGRWKLRLVRRRP